MCGNGWGTWKSLDNKFPNGVGWRFARGVCRFWDRVAIVQCVMARGCQTLREIDHFGRQKLGRTTERARPVPVTHPLFTQTKVSNLQEALRIQQQVI